MTSLWRSYSPKGCREEQSSDLIHDCHSRESGNPLLQDLGARSATGALPDYVSPILSDSPHYSPIGALSRWATPLRTAASLTASETRSCTCESRASGTSSDPVAREANFCAAASFMGRLISLAPERRAPRKMPG